MYIWLTDLVDEYFCALFRPVMLMAVLDIVAEHIPDLEALNLDGNKLQIIERLSVLCSKFPKLRILYIGDNKVSMHIPWKNKHIRSNVYIQF